MDKLIGKPIGRMDLELGESSMDDVVSGGIAFETDELRGFWKNFSRNAEFNKAGFLTLYRDTDEDTVLQILARYHETLGECLDTLERALITHDAERIWKASHKVAGSAELLGFGSFGNFAREFSLQVRANPVMNCHEPDFKEFIQRTEWLKKEISRSCPNLSTYLF